METKGNQTKSQTNAVTVYDVFIDQSPFSLIVIDTPGYRNTESTDNDLRIAAALHELCTSGVQDIDAVRLVVLSSTSRLMDRQQNMKRTMKKEYKNVWYRLTSSKKVFFAFLKKSKTVSLKMTEIVLKNCKQLTA
ncbi:hypothetical protein P4O66_005441 [Electrophorus voltai]|uniref:AIG1-type G domain-containing protein n=1 Tax=Electrophorus voltai TaxID=2609070 RepID=A0AAD9E788_9TELE|nr:hypothetical protein P4O66_005441 [Electrophorus voltai]